jgi:hypothetical protein
VFCTLNLLVLFLVPLSLALPQALLVVPPATLKTAVTHFKREAGFSSSEVVEVFRVDLGAALSMGYLEAGGEGLMDNWANRLDMAPQVRAGQKIKGHGP